MKTFAHWITSLAAIAGLAQAAPPVAAPAATAAAAPAAAAPSGAPADNAVFRVWIDNQGRKLDATFRGLQDGNVFLQVRNGFTGEPR